MEVIDQGAATTSQVGNNVVVESAGPYSSHSPPLVQQPSRGNSSFHSPTEGHVDDTTHMDYGPNAPFWDTSIGQVIASFILNYTVNMYYQFCIIFTSLIRVLNIQNVEIEPK